MSRRRFLRASLLAAPLAWPALALAGDDCRRIRFRHTHTGEQHCGCYFRDGDWDAAGLAALDAFLRDHRSGEQGSMDPRLFDLLHALAAQAGLPPDYELVSGFRSAATNAMLAARGGVSPRSLHLSGQALDVRLPGLPSARLAALAREQAAGGVGYYPRSDFVHLDTGRVRYWEG